MALRTRLDGRSEVNNSFTVFDKDGKELLTVTAISNRVELSIEAPEGIYIDKKNKLPKQGE